MFQITKYRAAVVGTWIGITGGMLAGLYGLFNLQNNINPKLSHVFWMTGGVVVTVVSGCLTTETERLKGAHAVVRRNSNGDIFKILVFERESRALDHYENVTYGNGCSAEVKAIAEFSYEEKLFYVRVTEEATRQA